MSADPQAANMKARHFSLRPPPLPARGSRWRAVPGHVNGGAAQHAWPGAANGSETRLRVCKKQSGEGARARAHTHSHTHARTHAHLFSCLRTAGVQTAAACRAPQSAVLSGPSKHHEGVDTDARCGLETRDARGPGRGGEVNRVWGMGREGKARAQV